MATHLTCEEAFNESAEGLAERIADLRYDEVQKFLTALSGKLRRDAEADAGRSRLKLSVTLAGASLAVGDAAGHIGEAWRISEPYM